MRGGGRRDLVESECLSGPVAGYLAKHPAAVWIEVAVATALHQRPRLMAAQAERGEHGNGLGLGHGVGWTAVPYGSDELSLGAGHLCLFGLARRGRGLLPSLLNLGGDVRNCSGDLLGSYREHKGFWLNIQTI